MPRVLNSFKILSNGKILDYRSGEKLESSKIKYFFQKNYKVKKIWQGSRHVLGILSKNNVDYFLKLSTSEGISVVTKNEYNWNNYFNQYFPKNLTVSVPKNHDSGLYQDKYFFLITDYFNGKLICDINGTVSDLVSYIEDIILFSELIQKMPEKNFSSLHSLRDNYQQKFIDKVINWFEDIPINIRKKFDIDLLLQIVRTGLNQLDSRPRHGDFTPWHMVKLNDSGIGLIDGEHAMPNSVEGYDICYFIQRIFSVLKDPLIARNIYFQLLVRGYKKNKLKTVFAARAIGGFLDESLIENPDYSFANKFKNWVINLN